MKKETLILAAFQVWTIGLMALCAGAFAFAIYNVCTGNYHSTPCREF